MSRSIDPHPREVLDALARRGPETRIALVGASDNPAKYGNIILKNLAAKGFTVLPVNPRHAEVEGLRAYATLADVPPPVHVVSIVTHPDVTLSVLKQVEALKLPHVFLQDGSFDDAVLEFVATASFKTVFHACIMVVTGRG